MGTSRAESDCAEPPPNPAAGRFASADGAADGTGAGAPAADSLDAMLLLEQPASAAMAINSPGTKAARNRPREALSCLFRMPL